MEREASDCAAMYDKFDCPRHLCVAHHQKAIKEQQVLAPKSSYLHVCASFFRDVVELAHARADLPPQEFAVRDAAIRKRAERLLRQYVTERLRAATRAEEGGEFACPRTISRSAPVAGDRQGVVPHPEPTLPFGRWSDNETAS